MSRRGWLLFLAMGVIWGVPYLLIKVAVRGVEPSVVVEGRTLVGALVLLPIALARGELVPALRHWRALAVYTAVEMGGPWLLLSRAEQRLPSSVTGLLTAAVPLVGLLVAWLAGERGHWDRRGLAGLAVGLAGVAAIVGLGLHASHLGALGELVVVVFGYALGPRIIANRLAEPPVLGVVAASVGLCALVYLPIAAVQAPVRLPSVRVLLALVTLGLVCTALAFVLFFALIGEVGPVRATVITYLNPAVAVLLGHAALHEPVTLVTLVGFVLVLGGCLLTNRAPHAPRVGVRFPVERI